MKRMGFKPFVSAQAAFSEVPGASRKRVSVTAKANELRTQMTKCLQHSSSLKVQGQLLRVIEEKSASAWSACIQSITSPLLQFALNAASDTLPHNANLAKWRKDHNLSDICKLCGER